MIELFFTVFRCASDWKDDDSRLQLLLNALPAINMATVLQLVEERVTRTVCSKANTTLSGFFLIFVVSNLTCLLNNTIKGLGVTKGHNKRSINIFRAEKGEDLSFQIYRSFYDAFK